LPPAASTWCYQRRLAILICVLFSANDAYMRDFTLYVPRDCTVSNTDVKKVLALKQMHKILKADIRTSTSIKLARLEAQGSAARR